MLAMTGSTVAFLNLDLPVLVYIALYYSMFSIPILLLDGIQALCFHAMTHTLYLHFSCDLLTPFMPWPDIGSSGPHGVPALVLPTYCGDLTTVCFDLHVWFCIVCGLNYAVCLRLAPQSDRTYCACVPGRFHGAFRNVIKLECLVQVQPLPRHMLKSSPVVRFFCPHRQHSFFSVLLLGPTPSCGTISPQYILHCKKHHYDAVTRVCPITRHACVDT